MGSKCCLWLWNLLKVIQAYCKHQNARRICKLIQGEKEIVGFAGENG